SVGATVTNPVYVFSDIGQRTECTITKISEPVPSPNQSRESGMSAMAGSGLNMEVRVSRTADPALVVTATVVSTSARAAPIPIPASNTCSDWSAYPGISPRPTERPNASTTADAGGNSNGLT